MFEFTPHDFFPWNKEDMNILILEFFSFRTETRLVKFSFKVWLILKGILQNQKHQNTELRNTEHRQNTGTMAEQQNTGRTIGIPENSGTCEEQRNNVTTKQHQEILPIQNDDILSRWHNKIQNKKVTLAKRIFMEKLNPVRRQFPCNKSAQENQKQNTYASAVIFCN